MRRNFYKYILITFIILIFWLFIVPLIFAGVVEIVCENLSYNTPYNVLVEKPRLCLNIIPVAVLKAKNITIKSKQTNDYFSADDINMKIRIFPLFSGRIHLDEVKAGSIDINAVLRTKAELDKNFVNAVKTAKCRCDAVNAEKINIKLLQEENSKQAEYKASNIFYINNGRYLKLNLQSEININNEISQERIYVNLPKDNNVNKSEINIHIFNLDIAPISEYLKNYLPKDLVSASGTIDADIDKNHLEAVLKNVSIIKKDDAKSMIFPDKLSVKSGLNLTRKTITIDNAEIKSKNTDTVLAGTISGYLDRPLPEYNLNIRINKSRIEDFISMLPPFKTEDIDVYKLKKYKFYGDVIGNLSVKGDNLEPSVNGSMYINNGILTKPIPNAKGTTIKLDFKGKYLNFEVIVPAGFSEKVNVKGGVELYNVKYSDMRVWSTQNVDLSIAQEKVVPLHEILNFIIGPVPLMDIKGLGNIDINIKGNRKNPHIWGVFNLNKVTTYFLEMPDLKLKDGAAVLKFEDENAVFNLKNGHIDGKEISIDGNCNLSGKFDFDVTANNQNLEYIYRAIKTSTIIDDIKNMLPNFDTVKGLSNLRLKVYGNIKDFKYKKFNENFFIKGGLELLGNTIEAGSITIHDATGVIKFNNTNAQMNISSFIGASPLNFTALINDKYSDIVLDIPKLNLRDVLPKNDKFSQEIANIYVKVKAAYKGKIDAIEYDKLNFDAQILNVAKNNILKLSNGAFSLKNGKLQIRGLNGNFSDTKSSFNINLSADNVTTRPTYNGNIQLKDFELSLINSFGEYNVIPQNIRNIINLIHFEKGKININAKLSNNNVNASTDVGGIEFIYAPLEIPVKVVNGSIFVRKNSLGLNKINLIADDMPILIDGSVNNIFSKQDFSLYLNSKPKQDFIDKYINNNRIYPLKLRGDIVYSVKLKGTVNDFNTVSEVNMAKDSSIYYMGATVGDIENSIILNFDINILKHKFLKIKEFSYDKLIDSQGKRQTRLNMLKVSGGADILQDDLLFKDLRLKTTHPTDVRILNILFKKPNIKQGQFTSDLKINGKLSNPYIIGNFNINETNIPFFDTTMKNISFIFKEKNIDLYSKGEVLGNDIIFKGTLKNKLTFPYYIYNAELNTKDIDLNYITNRLKDTQLHDSVQSDSFASFDLKNTVIKKLKLTADHVKLRNLTAEGVEAYISINEKKVFNIDKVKFKAANGSIDGRFSYNLLNDNTWIHLNTKGINANDMAIALFDLNNQIYGDLTGNVKLSCNGYDFNKCMETLNGSVVFDVKDGRMPKLGSLEYLLRAGNIVKGGLTGLSLNNVIDILIPLKTGDFSEIYGKMNVKNGVTDDIEISTKGKDLNLFIYGTYNFGNSIAQMEVLGLLSKNISTMLGPIGNVSLNTLFNIVPGVDLAKDSKLLDKINKIPAIELNSKAFRKFIAEINGNINGDNYVKSFKWIN